MKSTTEPDITFHKIRAWDFSALSSFLQENDVSSVARTFDPFPMSEESARSIALEARLDHYYGAFLGDRLVGLSMLRGWDEGYAIPSFGIMVDHRYHNRGIGGRMLDYTLAKARELGCERVRLTVYASNVAGARLYTDRGFVEQSRASATVMGEADEKIVMLKELGPILAREENI